MSNVNAFHEQYSFIHSESVFSTACVSCIVLDVQGNEMNETSSLPSKSSMRGKVYIYFSWENGRKAAIWIFQSHPVYRDRGDDAGGWPLLDY